MSHSSQSLDLSGRGLTSLGRYGAEVWHVTVLALNRNQLSSLKGVEQFSRLLQLSVRSNRLVDIGGVAFLSHLVMLNLQDNSITTIRGLEQLTNLQWVCLAGNSIKEMTGVESCAALTHLDLSDNCVAALVNLSQLTSLKTLLLHGNAINSLHRVQEFLPVCVQTLTLAENSIVDLNEVSSLSALKSLKQLSLMGNPCTSNLPMGYRAYVLHWCGQLTVLDGSPVTQQERYQGVRLFSQFSQCPFSRGQHRHLLQFLAGETSPKDTSSFLKPYSLPHNNENFSPNHQPAISHSLLPPTSSSYSSSSSTIMTSLPMTTNMSDMAANSPPVLQTLKALRYVQQMIATQEQLLLEKTTPNTRQVAYQELAHESAQSGHSQGIGKETRRVSQFSTMETVPSCDSRSGAVDTFSSHPQAVPGLPKSAWTSDCDMHGSSSSGSDCSMNVGTVRCLNDAPQVKLISSSASLHDKVDLGKRPLLHVDEHLLVEEVELPSHDRSSVAMDQSPDLSHDQITFPETLPHVSVSEENSDQGGGVKNDDSVVLLPATSESLTATSSTTEGLLHSTSLHLPLSEGDPPLSAIDLDSLASTISQAYGLPAEDSPHLLSNLLVGEGSSKNAPSMEEQEGDVISHPIRSESSTPQASAISVSLQDKPTMSSPGVNMPSDKDRTPLVVLRALPLSSSHWTSDERRRAATQIQAVVRGHLCRRNGLLKRHRAAMMIQAAWRGYWTRCYHPVVLQVMSELRRKKLEGYVTLLYLQVEGCREELAHQIQTVQIQEETIHSLISEVEELQQWKKKKEMKSRKQAAIIIQKHWRGYRIRRVHTLSRVKGVVSLHSLACQCSTLQKQVHQLQDMVDSLRQQKQTDSEPIMVFLSPPQKLQMTHHSPTCLLLHWEPPAPAPPSYTSSHSNASLLLGYRVYVNGTPEGMVDCSKARAYIEGLEGSVSYRLTVRAVYKGDCESLDSNPVIASLTPPTSASMVGLQVTSSGEPANTSLQPPPAKRQDQIAIWEPQEERSVTVEDFSHTESPNSMEKDSTTYNTCQDEVTDATSSTGRSLASTFTKSVAEELSSSHVDSISSHSVEGESLDDDIPPDSLAELPVESHQKHAYPVVSNRKDPCFTHLPTVSSSEQPFKENNHHGKELVALTLPSQVLPQESHLSASHESSYSPGSLTYQPNNFLIQQQGSTTASPSTTTAEASSPSTEASPGNMQAGQLNLSQGSSMEKPSSTLNSFSATEKTCKPRKSFFSFPDS